MTAGLDYRDGRLPSLRNSNPVKSAASITNANPASQRGSSPLA